MYSRCERGGRTTPLRKSDYYQPLLFYDFVQNEARTTKCEGSKPSPNNPYKDQIAQLQRELDEPCKSCMYTGMAVCTGLSLYFAKLATDDVTLPKNRRFLWACSAGSIVAGAYRWYLG